MAARTHLMPRHLHAKRENSERTRLYAGKQSIQLVFITCLVFAAIIGAAIVFMYIGHQSYEYKERNWNGAVATIKDVRTRLVSQANGLQGGAMLYEVQVLATFSANGSPQERWITVDQRPNNLDYANFQGRVWKGKQYFVRWNPSDPNSIVIDLH